MKINGLPEPLASTFQRYIDSDDIHLPRAMERPVLVFNEDRATFNMDHPMAHYDDLTLPEAKAIAEAHSLLGWDLEYDQLGVYLSKNYPWIFK